MMSLIKKLSQAKIQIIYLILFVTLAIPMFRPIGIPVPMEKDTMDIWNTIESLKPGDVAVLGNGFGANYSPEVYPQYIVIMEQLFRKEGIKILIVDHLIDSSIFTIKALNEIKAFDRRIYGVDFVDLGFIPGAEAAIAGLCKNLHGLLEVDYKGNKLSDLPMLKNINSAKDFTVIITFGGDVTGVFWLNQAYATVGTKVAWAVPAIKVSDAIPYYQAGQIFGIMESVKGAAQYEILLNKPGVAVRGLDAQSLAHIYFIGLIFIGNWIYFTQEKRKK